MSINISEIIIKKLVNKYYMSFKISCLLFILNAHKWHFVAYFFVFLWIFLWCNRNVSSCQYRPYENVKILKECWHLDRNGCCQLPLPFIDHLRWSLLATYSYDRLWWPTLAIVGGNHFRWPNSNGRVHQPTPTKTTCNDQLNYIKLSIRTYLSE